MSLLPALVDGDLEAFGKAITTIQQINGSWFAPAQGGPFASGASTELINKMREWGAAGVGQSSWGPAVYAITEGDDVRPSLLHGRASRSTEAEWCTSISSRAPALASPCSTRSARADRSTPLVLAVNNSPRIQ